MYNNTNWALCQEELETITNSKTSFVLQRIEERINLRNAILPYVKKAINNNVIYKRLEECGTQIWIDEQTGKIGTANFCKNRLCPVCNYRRSAKQWGRIYKAVTEHNNKYKYLLITLTVENCKGEDLTPTIDEILNSLHRFANRKKWKRAIHGYVRGLEITYNNIKNTFHPHIHLLCAVMPEYFNNPALYISGQELSEFWQTSARLSYRPSTDIRAVKDNKKAVAEVAKYALKMADILQAPTINAKRAKAVEILYKAIQNRRLMAISGCFKTEFNIDELDNIDLTEFENKRKCIELLKAEKRTQYLDMLYSLNYYTFSKLSHKFDKHEKVNKKGAFLTNESIRN